MTCTYTFNTAQGVKTIEGREAMIEFLGRYGVGAIVPRNAPANGIHVGIARAALAQAYGDLPDQLERKGLLAVSQTLDDAIDRAAQMRANATGQSVDDVRSELMDTVQNSLSPMKSVDANVRRGLESLAKALDEKTTVHRAMYRNGLGWVDFVWGDVGKIKPSGKTKGAMGLAHIFEARQRKDGLTDAEVRTLLAGIVNAIASGAEVRRNEVSYSISVTVQKDGIEAILTKSKASNTWLVSGWNKINPADSGAGSVASTTTVQTPTTAQRQKVSRFADIVRLGDLNVKRSSNGDVQAFFDPQTGTAHMVAEHLSAESAPGVMMHEVGIHMAADGSMQPIFNRAKMLLRTQQADPFMQRVQARLDAAGETSGEEAAAYMVEEYERDRLSAPASVRRWLQTALATVKAWLNRKGIIGADKLTVADIAAVARANARTVAWGDDEAGIKFSRISEDVWRARWSDDRIADLLGRYAYPASPARTNAYAATISPGAFLDATTPASERAALEAESTQLDTDQLAGERQPIMLEVEAESDDGEYRVVGHEGRHRMVALRNAGISSVPVVIVVRDGPIDDAQMVDNPYFSPQVWKSEGVRAKRGFEVRSMTPVSHAYADAIRDDFGRPMADDAVMFSRTPQWQEPKEQPQAEQPPTWGLPEVNKWTDRWDYATYNLQDRQIDTKRVQQSIEANNGPLPDELNVRQREELFYGRDAKEVQDFKTQELNPMLEQLGKDGIELPEFEQYLHARHAPEANRVMAERNPNQEMIDQGRAQARQRIDALSLELDGATDPDATKLLNRELAQAMSDLARWRNVQPYTGTEESRLALSGMSNEQAQEIMDGLTPEVLAGMERSAAMFDAIVAKNRTLMVEYGLESGETVDGWANLFQHYVPLMREEAEGAGLHNGLGTGQGFSIKGREVKSRTGSAKKKVVDIVANLAMQRERTITRGEKNRVATTMVELARANPNPDFWKVGAPDRKRVYDRATRTVKWVTDPAYKQRDEVVVAKFVKDNGQIEEVALTFNKADPRAMRMATAFKNLDDASLNKMLRTAAPVTRALAALSTQYNPTWGIFNFIRDTFGLMISLGSTPLTGKNGNNESIRLRVYRDAFLAFPALWRGARMERKGKEDTSEWGRLWEDFQKVGGATGFRDMIRSSNERTGQFKTVIDPDAWMETPWGKAITLGGTIKPLAGKAERKRKAWFDEISDFNLGLENASRVATYKAALDQGLSKEQAASIAKNITVNFNRRGAVGHQIGAAYAFFNASVQGTARMAEAVTVMSRPGDPRSIRLTDFGKAVVYGGLALGALQALALAAAGFEDDEPPEFVRDRNLTIPTGWTAIGPDKGYITLPMPLGFNIIPAFGRRLTEFVLSGGKDPFKHASGLVGLVFEGFNPIGSGSFLQMLAPSVLDPIVAAIQNEDSFGRPIARETMDRNVPGHQLARDAATDVSRFLSRTINTITGGDEYTAGKWSPSPDQLDYVVGQYGGGVAREIIKLWQLASGTARGEEVPFYKVPLLGRFAGSADGASSQGNAYYSNINKIDQAEKRIKGLTEDGKRSEAQAERRKPEALLIAKAKVAQREVSRLRQEKRRLLETGAERAKVRAVEAKITDAMRRLNEAAKAKGI